jgi:hypothetical protein
VGIEIEQSNSAASIPVPDDGANLDRAIPADDQRDSPRSKDLVDLRCDRVDRSTDGIDILGKPVARIGSPSKQRRVAIFDDVEAPVSHPIEEACRTQGSGRFLLTGSEGTGTGGNADHAEGSRHRISFHPLRRKLVQ